MSDESAVGVDRGLQDGGRRGHPWRRRLWIALALIIAVPVLLFAAWAAVALRYTYSRGTRAGYVQKFSKKGWLCKTWEGELAMVNVPGAMQERWQFSVRNDSIAALINDNMGKRLALTYDQHKGVPTSCFGDTEYYVIGVRAIP